MEPRYWLFAGESYYACGGMQNFRGRFASVAAAVAHLHVISNSHRDWPEWYQIVDVIECRVVKHHGGGGYGTEWERDQPEWPDGVTFVPQDETNLIEG